MMRICQPDCIVELNVKEAIENVHISRFSSEWVGDISVDLANICISEILNTILLKQKKRKSRFGFWGKLRRRYSVKTPVRKLLKEMEVRLH